MRFVPVLAAVTMAFMAGGCATIVNGKTQEVPIATIPPGATVCIDSSQTVITPASVNLRRNKDYILTVMKDGYHPQTVQITGVLSGWLAGNLLFGGIIGGGIDAATGAGFTLTPDKIAITMVPLAPGQAAAPVPTGPLSLDDRDRLADQMKADGMLDEKQHTAVKKKIEEERKKAAAKG
ncbi:MAG TPA: PEGA domain-containing protein [Phycisphaerales bacterium]|nr:PEGA domain-containing protein [Phycisphaerales bacterium]